MTLRMIHCRDYIFVFNTPAKMEKSMSIIRHSYNVKEMPSDIIIASIILAGGIGGSIWWAQRDRTLNYTGKAFLGRNEDRLEQKIDTNNRQLKQVLEIISKTH